MYCAEKLCLLILFFVSSIIGLLTCVHQTSSATCTVSTWSTTTSPLSQASSICPISKYKSNWMSERYRLIWNAHTLLLHPLYRFYLLTTTTLSPSCPGRRLISPTDRYCTAKSTPVVTANSAHPKAGGNTRLLSTIHAFLHIFQYLIIKETYSMWPLEGSTDQLILPDFVTVLSCKHKKIIVDTVIWFKINTCFYL